TGAVALLGMVAVSRTEAQTCVGDCGGTGMVRINDLVLGVNISLGLQPVSACPAFQNDEGNVDIAQLVRAVNNALRGCTPSGPTATPTASETTTPPTQTPTATPGVCGDNVIDAGEQCDPVGSSCGGTALCQSDCTCPCDFLDGSECLFPFPSDYLTIADASTDTGRRVHYATDTMPRNMMGTPIVPDEYNRNDGFSPGSSILLHVPGIDLAETGAAPITDIARSLDAGAPIVLVNASSHEHHLMWTELDANATADATRALIIRPGVTLEEGTRY